MNLPTITTSELATLFTRGLDALLEALAEAGHAGEPAEGTPGSFRYPRDAVVAAVLERRIPFLFPVGDGMARIEALARSEHGEFEVFICLAAFPGCCEGAQISEIWIRKETQGETPDLLDGVALIASSGAASEVKGPTRFVIRNRELSLEDLVPDFEV